MNEQLQQLEEQLESIPKNKLYFIYISIIALLVYLGWNLFGESMYMEMEAKEESIVSLEQKLQRNSVKALESAINRTKKENLTIKEELGELEFKDRYILNKLNSVDFVFFNQMGIAHILDDILKESVKNSIDIKLVNYNSVNKLYKSRVFEKESIDINGSSRFKDMMSLIQYIDSLNALLKINLIDVYMDENQTTNFNLNISHYGVEL